MQKTTFKTLTNTIIIQAKILTVKKCNNKPVPKFTKELILKIKFSLLTRNYSRRPRPRRPRPLPERTERTTSATSSGVGGIPRSRCNK